MKNILLLNLGSPKSTDKRHVREYLEEFMSDDHVLDFPKFFIAHIYFFDAYSVFVWYFSEKSYRE